MRSRAIVTAFAAVGLFAFAIPANASAQTENENEKIVVQVKKGDNLSKIADKNNTTYQRLYDANLQIKHPDVIFPEQKVRIPAEDEKLPKRELPADAQPPAPKPAPKKAAVKSAPVAAVSYPAPSNAGVWDRLAQCESGGNWSINTGNGYYGGLQFSLSSWRAVGGNGYPHQASKSEQIARAEILKSRQGWGAWPSCSAQLGLR